MTAALAIADSGYDVHLVERTEMLGGNLPNLYYVAEGYDPQRLLRDLVNRVRAHQRIVRSHPHRSDAPHRACRAISRPNCARSNPTAPSNEFQIEHGVTIVATGGVRPASIRCWICRT